ncbi:gypsy retrotransposon integrase-like protein, partial [Trifolium medium]|nr:gypsy retrotransposon integrase-like protein [Trifolium medium]
MLLCLGKDESKRLLPRYTMRNVEATSEQEHWRPKHANIHHSPAEALQSVTSLWPFLKWGVDILGPFTAAANQVKFLIAAVDYFTKWIEAEPVATIG